MEMERLGVTLDARRRITPQKAGGRGRRLPPVPPRPRGVGVVGSTTTALVSRPVFTTAGTKEGASPVLDPGPAKPLGDRRVVRIVPQLGEAECGKSPPIVAMLGRLSFPTCGRGSSMYNATRPPSARPFTKRRREATWERDSTWLASTDA